VKAGSRILLIEDNQGILETMSDILVDEGAVVETASTVAQARALLGSKRYDAALVDIVLPDGSGVELIRQFKPRLPDTRFIVVTAYANEAPAQTARDEGLALVLHKPVNPAELVRLV
jgi:DNA-binding response OmpR family regulator